MNLVTRLSLASLAYVLLTMPAHAYIDPVTGSILFQAIAGGFAAALVAIKSFREKVFGFFRKKPEPQDDTSEVESEG
ncbi:hypothetical protein [Oceanomicrobium pacificus]|uniref:Uncharacterized protein n=1 Tax=Oceanomicrobium pacificus TaxID=2692916 RepID=A0A6B0TPE3_9RHOB|nr:hypothetical protein [Oceanomicrobium pacificus]MXU66437.1 hypothetical protein [Oceanomicrobium pacificus]